MVMAWVSSDDKTGEDHVERHLGTTRLARLLRSVAGELVLRLGMTQLARLLRPVGTVADLWRFGAAAIRQKPQRLSRTARAGFRCRLPIAADDGVPALPGPRSVARLGGSQALLGCDVG